MASEHGQHFFIKKFKNTIYIQNLLLPHPKQVHKRSQSARTAVEIHFWRFYLGGKLVILRFWQAYKQFLTKNA